MVSTSARMTTSAVRADVHILTVNEKTLIGVVELRTNVVAMIEERLSIFSNRVEWS